MAKWEQLHHFTWTELSNIQLSWGNIKDFSDEQLFLLLKKSIHEKNKRLSIENWISVIAIVLEIAFRIHDANNLSPLEYTVEMQSVQIESLSTINEMLIQELESSNNSAEILQLIQHTTQCLEDLGLLIDNSFDQSGQPVNPESVIQNDNLSSDQSESE